MNALECLKRFRAALYAAPPDHAAIDYWCDQYVHAPMPSHETLVSAVAKHLLVDCAIEESQLGKYVITDPREEEPWRKPEDLV